jgi:hypothetical protein
MRIMKKISYLIVILLLIACSPIGKISVTNVHDLASFRENSFIYVLPRTRIRIEVVAISYFTIPGPYNAYAEKYLGIKGTPSISNTQWELKDIYLDAFREPDPDQYYSLQAENPTTAINSLLKFTEAGLIVDQEEFTPFLMRRIVTDDAPEPIHFTDLSVKRNIAGDPDKPKVGSSGVPIDLPVTKTKSGVKTIEQKAEEAANFIIKIRKRRFKLLAGQYNVFPEGTALETSISELNKLEAEYLSLFIGKVYTDSINRVFYYIPKVGQTLERNVFCRFSDEAGIQDAMSLSGKPLVLEVKNMEFTAPLRDVQNPFLGPTFEDIIFYRVPDKAFTRVFYGSTNIVESEIDVLQYGVLVPCSLKLMSNNK